ncbi:MAG: hypothetical protein WCP39_07670, partial [Chlamydiota bacterium]
MKFFSYKFSFFLMCFFSPIYSFGTGETSQELIVRRVYDSENHLTEVLYPDGKKVEYVFDEKGNRIQMNDWTGSTHYTYDGSNRLSRVQIPNIGIISYSYDTQGNIQKVLYPSRYKILYEYTENNLLQSVIDSSGKTFFFYDPASHLLTKTVSSNGVSSEYIYNGNRLSGIAHKKSDGSLIVDLRYEFDNGKMVQETITTPSSTLTKKHVYNSANQLKKVEYSNGFFEKYFYNAKGFCSSKTTPSQKTVFKYDSRDRLKKAGETEFSYDENDNLIKKVSPGKIIEYSYDIENHLIQYRDNENTVVFTYNGDGCRIGKTVNGSKTFFAEDTLSPIPEVMIKVAERKDFLGKLYRFFIGEEQKKFTYFTYGKDRINRLEDDNSFVYLYDQNKNVIALVDAFEKVNNLYLYDSSGNVIEKGAEFVEDFSYTAKQYDAETGLIYTGNNYFDPQDGIYLVGGEHVQPIVPAPEAPPVITVTKPTETPPVVAQVEPVIP